MAKLNWRTKTAHLATHEPGREAGTDEWCRLLTDLLVPGVLQRPVHDAGARRAS